MNLPKKGPDLKLSGLKVPDFLLDLYHDLRERHLLPLVVLLLIGIVAAPIALGGSSTPDAPTAGGGAVATPSAVPSGTDLVVAKAAPGLRSYQKRLRRLKAKDPFKQQFTESESTTAAGAAPETTASASSEGSSLPTGAASVPATATPEPATEGSGPTETQTKYATSTIDVRIVPVSQGSDGAAAKAQPSVRRGLPELTMLPDRNTPAAVFMGTSADDSKALLLVSSDVNSIFGDGQCVVGSQLCQLLALEPGLPETFVYGPQNRTYRIEILKIDQIVSDKPQRAALGDPKKTDTKAPKSE